MTRAAVARGGTKDARHPAAGRHHLSLKGRRILRDTDSSEGEGASPTENKGDVTIVPARKGLAEEGESEYCPSAADTSAGRRAQRKKRYSTLPSEAEIGRANRQRTCRRPIWRQV